MAYKQPHGISMFILEQENNEPSLSRSTERKINKRIRKDLRKNNTRVVIKGSKEWINSDRKELTDYAKSHVSKEKKRKLVLQVPNEELWDKKSKLTKGKTETLPAGSINPDTGKVTNKKISKVGTTPDNAGWYKRVKGKFNRGY